MLKINQGEHVFIAGRTGSGKTFLVKKYLQNSKLPIYCLDLKQTLNWSGVSEKDIGYYDSLEDVIKSKKRKVIYQPKWEEIDNNIFINFFEFCYKRGDCIVWVDETMGIGSALKYPAYYKALLTRGRELGISVWSCTQRPASIPIIALSEATHFFIFDLNMLKDRVRISDIVGEDDFTVAPGKFSFWYYHISDSEHPIRARLTKKKGG